MGKKKYKTNYTRNMQYGNGPEMIGEIYKQMTLQINKSSDNVKESY